MSPESRTSVRLSHFLLRETPGSSTGVLLRLNSAIAGCSCSSENLADKKGPSETSGPADGQEESAEGEGSYMAEEKPLDRMTIERKKRNTHMTSHKKMHLSSSG